MKKLQIDELKNLPFVQQIEPDPEVTTFMKTVSNSTELQKRGKILQEIWMALRANIQKMMCVAVIDTGIHTGQVDLDSGKMIVRKDYVNIRATPYDDNGDGTHVSGHYRSNWRRKLLLQNECSWSSFGWAKSIKFFRFGFPFQHNSSCGLVYHL